VTGCSASGNGWDQTIAAIGVLVIRLLTRDRGLGTPPRITHRSTNGSYVVRYRPALAHRKGSRPRAVIDQSCAKFGSSGSDRGGSYRCSPGGSSQAVDTHDHDGITWSGVVLIAAVSTTRGRWRPPKPCTRAVIAHTHHFAPLIDSVRASRGRLNALVKRNFDGNS
jgi:hypothetical protein